MTPPRPCNGSGGSSDYLVQQQQAGGQDENALSGTFSTVTHPYGMTIMHHETTIPSRTQAAQPGEAGLDDYALVERVRRGDLAAFELIMRRYNRRLFRAAFGVLGNPSEAEDAMQETYLRAYASLRSFKGPQGFASWITRIAVNEALGRVRKRGRVIAFSDISATGSDADERSIEGMQAPEPGPERLAANAELRRYLERAIAALSPDFRTVFMLREVEGLSVAETADAIGIAEETVKTRLHRAKHQLRRALGGDTSELMPSVHEFAGRRCDRVVATVLRHLGAPPGA